MELSDLSRPRHLTQSYRLFRSIDGGRSNGALEKALKDTSGLTTIVLNSSFVLLSMVRGYTSAATWIICLQGATVLFAVLSGAVVHLSRESLWMIEGIDWQPLFANASADGGSYIEMLPHTSFRVPLPLDGARARLHHSRLRRLVGWLTLETVLWVAVASLAAYLSVWQSALHASRPRYRFQRWLYCNWRCISFLRWLPNGQRPGLDAIQAFGLGHFDVVSYRGHKQGRGATGHCLLTFTQTWSVSRSAAEGSGL